MAPQVSLFKILVKFSDFVHLSTAELSFRAGSPNTAGTGLTENNGRDSFNQAQNFNTHFAYFPLCPLAAAQGEKV